ncbi:hypothetical protein C7437_10861 [Psychrobacillus insolitus]|uniref:Uncharacterized protein n=1 Tax=Psychrobacillus insolitus TaxID=1461 RepID=A0A2W7MM21_9BACI|nr:hypothetical protein [Psychrobacillus insolitus]PZX02966.1 hypothetical protein C7437_10861 [Psychrobacillus insolitus]
MKKSKIIVPIMVVVAVLATIMLNSDEYNEVTIINRILIIAGAAIISSVIGYFLLGVDVDKVDPKPPTNTYNNKKGNGK